MTTAPQIALIKAYARRVREARRAHPGVTEPGLAPEFHQFLVNILPHLPAAPALTVLAEFINAGLGRPDIAMKRPGELARAFVELKSLDKPTDGRRWTLHAAEIMPWPDYETRKWERLFPQLAEALPPDEASQLFSEFRRHLDRLGASA